MDLSWFVQNRDQRCAGTARGTARRVLDVRAVGTVVQKPSRRQGIPQEMMLTLRLLEAWANFWNEWTPQDTPTLASRLGMRKLPGRGSAVQLPLVPSLLPATQTFTKQLLYATGILVDVEICSQHNACLQRLASSSLCKNVSISFLQL